MPAQPQFLSDLNIIGTKMLRNELRNFRAGECIDSKHVIFLPPVCPTPSTIITSAKICHGVTTRRHRTAIHYDFPCYLLVVRACAVVP